MNEGREESVRTCVSSFRRLSQGHVDLDQWLLLRVEGSHTRALSLHMLKSCRACYVSQGSLRGFQELCAPGLEQLHDGGEARHIPGPILGNRVTPPPQEEVTLRRLYGLKLWSQTDLSSNLALTL